MTDYKKREWLVSLTADVVEKSTGRSMTANHEFSLQGDCSFAPMAAEIDDWIATTMASFDVYPHEASVKCWVSDQQDEKGGE